MTSSSTVTGSSRYSAAPSLKAICPHALEQEPGGVADQRVRERVLLVVLAVHEHGRCRRGTGGGVAPSTVAVSTFLTL